MSVGHWVNDGLMAVFFLLVELAILTPELDEAILREAGFSNVSLLDG